MQNESERHQSAPDFNGASVNTTGINRSRRGNGGNRGPASWVPVRWMTNAEASDYTRLSTRRIDYARERGELSFTRVGRKLLFTIEALDAWLTRMQRTV